MQIAVKIIRKQKIELAIKQKKYIRIDYVGKTLKLSKDRLVEPLEIKDTSGEKGDVDSVLTLFAHCFKGNGIRNFELDGIQKVELVDKESIGRGSK